MAKRIRLNEGTNWVKLEPLSEGIALVVGGNAHTKDDLVARPIETSWDESSAPGAVDGDTVVSPFDLQLCYDGLTGECFLPPGDASAHEGLADSKSRGAVKLLAFCRRQADALSALARTTAASSAAADAEEIEGDPDAHPRRKSSRRNAA